MLYDGRPAVLRRNAEAVHLTARCLIGVRRTVPLDVARICRFIARAEFWERDMPRQIGLAAVAAAVQETTDAAECEADRHAWCNQVGHREKWQSVLENENCETNRSADESTVNNKTAFGNIDDL